MQPNARHNEKQKYDNKVFLLKNSPVSSIEAEIKILISINYNVCRIHMYRLEIGRTSTLNLVLDDRMSK